MHNDRCGRCGQILFFESSACTACGAAVGFDPDALTVVAVVPDGDALRAAGAERRYRRCANDLSHGACNWLLRAEEAPTLCRACRLNRTIPDLSVPGNAELWRQVEAAKRRALYSVLRLGLPVASAWERAGGLAFDLLAGEAVRTGHAGGVITIDIGEADPVAREAARTSLDERYRTLLGHFRHELGHYYWPHLVPEGATRDAFRGLFGDERADYAAALARHHDAGAPGGWQQRSVSAYASAHPWEDWAETFAHYLHMIDTLDTARGFGISLAPEADGRVSLATRIAFDPYADPDCTRLLGAWIPLTVALNALNRSMGLPDPYPFALSPRVQEKLAWVHQRMRARDPEA